jgi:hypothetical protein
MPGMDKSAGEQKILNLKKAGQISEQSQGLFKNPLMKPDLTIGIKARLSLLQNPQSRKSR